MRVRRIQLQNFACHGSVDVSLPDTGVVLVTGPNGSGKSSAFLDAVSVGAWGYPLRNASLFAGDTGSVSLDTDLFSSALTLKGGKKRLQWQRAGEAAVAYENYSKASEALEGLVGTASLWASTHVFTSFEAETFTLASDKSRKLFLERLIGLTGFEEGYRKVRADSVTYANRVDALARELTVFKEHIPKLETELKEALEWQKTLPPLVPMPSVEEEIAETRLLTSRKLAEHGTLQARQTAMQKTLQRLSSQISSKASAIAVSAGKEKALLSRQAETDALLRALREGKCGQCGSVLGELRCLSQLEALNAESTLRKQEIEREREAGVRLQAERAQLESERTSAESVVEQLAREMEAVRVRITELQTDMVGLEAQLKAFDDKALTHAVVNGTVTRVQEQLQQARERMQAKEQQKAHEDRQLQLHMLVTEALGYKGIRGRLLTRTLRTLEELANGWLYQLSGGSMRIKLDSYRQDSEGNAIEAVTLKVALYEEPLPEVARRVAETLGDATFREYLSFSQGERRRVDVAFMFAFVDLVEAAFGRAEGTCFYDEVFDGLDLQGVQAVCRALQARGKVRCQVVITHREDVVDALQPTQRYVLPFQR